MATGSFNKRTDMTAAIVAVPFGAPVVVAFSHPGVAAIVNSVLPPKSAGVGTRAEG